MAKIEIDDLNTVKRIDRGNMLKLLADFPGQCMHAKRIGEDFKIDKSYFEGCSNIVFTGLGGSAIGADLVRSYTLDEIKFPLFVNRNYTLPDFVSGKSLVVVSSYSGNTEETISAYKDAAARGAKLVAVTSGGKIAEMASSDGAGLLIIPKGLPPRCALGYSFFPSLILLSKLGLIPDKSREIDSAIAGMEAMRDKRIGPGVKKDVNLAKAIAEEIYGKYAVIYGGQDRLDAVIVRWRGQLAENSKTLSSTHVFPEMNHNEIVGWENPKGLFDKLAVLFLRDRDDHPRTKRRMDITRGIIEKEGACVTEVESVGDSVLERIFSLVYTGDFVSFYLAVSYGVDPTPVDRVAYLKNELAKG